MSPTPSCFTLTFVWCALKNRETVNSPGTQLPLNQHLIDTLLTLSWYSTITWSVHVTDQVLVFLHNFTHNILLTVHYYTSNTVHYDTSNSPLIYHWQFTDVPPTVHQYSTTSSLIYHQQSTNNMLPTVDHSRTVKVSEPSVDWHTSQTRAVIKFWVTCSLVLHTRNKTCYFVIEFYQQQANISLVASRENQAYSAVTGVIGYGPADHQSPRWLIFRDMLTDSDQAIYNWKICLKFTRSM